MPHQKPIPSSVSSSRIPTLTMMAFVTSVVPSSSASYSFSRSNLSPVFPKRFWSKTDTHLKELLAYSVTHQRKIRCSADLEDQGTNNTDSLVCSRRSLLKWVALAIPTAVTALALSNPEQANVWAAPLSSPASPESVEGGQVRTRVAKVIQLQIRIQDFVDKVKQMNAVTDDDSSVFLRYVPIFIDPIQENMAEAAKKISGNDPEAKIMQLPALMKGHILELKQAIRAKNTKDILEELEEIKETSDDFLTLANDFKPISRVIK